MKNRQRHIARRAPALLLAASGLLAGVPADARQRQSPDDYNRADSAWRAGREATLRADDGWLTLVGLHWLREGANSVGRSPTADVPLP